jgi:putative aminopeptidase FrvX
MALPKILKDLLSLPTAPLLETAVMDYIQSTCTRLRGISCRFDRYGNLLAHYRRRPRPVPPLVFAAHADHPGFLAQEMLDKRTLRAAFRGYVESPYFANARVRFWSGGRWVQGEVVELTRTVPIQRMGRKTSRPEEVLLRVTEAIEPNAPGMWDLPDPVLRDDRLYARDHDDLAGVAAMLTLLERLTRKQTPAEVYCLFTRAEELGRMGAVGAAKTRTVPKKLPIIAIETSKELPSAHLGDGPILRVGDRMSVFTPELTAFAGRVAQDLVRRRKSFAFQRKLMDGGTCESTAYLVYGYRATGVCLALQNYHNMDTERGEIASELISLADWQRMVDWFEALVQDEQGFRAAEVGRGVRVDLDQRFASCAALLSAPAHRRDSHRESSRAAPCLPPASRSTPPRDPTTV